MAAIDASLLPALLGRTVAYHAVFTLLPGVTVTGAVFLSQAFFWTRTPTVQKRNGWFYKSQSGNEDSWESETGLSPKQQVSARRSLSAIGVLEEDRRGVPARTWYRINCDRLAQLLAEALDDNGPEGSGISQTLPKGESRSSLTENLDSLCRMPLVRPKVGTITEMTTEKTTDKKSSGLTRAELAELLGQQQADLIARRYGSDLVGTAAVEAMRETLKGLDHEQ
ncbi:hypothetical protein [Halomonas elongata]|uniref:Uncharacterized protein n=2 Tax=Halomonas elongata TaxID=2746 RepID=A0A1R4A4G3_HALED|nr:hypothetical protein [Halomonas elongata]OBX33920.1 hypothetical protein A8U91_02963 [Halomonas elongata]WBF16940.1 hypothetical protein LM502_12665 [Halomonas elongata]WPU45771.1 hypothetical protein SR933_10890 [Halomonas elongata DSM 2581]SJK83851.1 uncharacterized protein HELO_3301B [Halomonas elongata DSM 2581]